MKKLDVKMMTKQLADALAKQSEAREKKVDAGIAVKRGQKKSKKSK